MASMGKRAKDKARKKERKKALRLTFTEADATTDVESRPGSGAAPPGIQTTPDSGPAVLLKVAVPHRGAVEAMELAARWAGLSTVLQRHLSRADAGEGLTRARLSALSLLVLGGPRTLGDLAAAEHVRPPTMTRLVHAMEADGLVGRAPNPNDGRSVVIHATVTGIGQLELGSARQIAPLARTIAGLDRSERTQLEDAADLLGRMLRDSAWESGETRD
jgi:DNA-binding MarR family transcriptional regulator